MAQEKSGAQPIKTGEKRITKDVKAMVKAFAGIRRKIRKALEAGEKTIPQIAVETGLPGFQVTYTLMTMLKYGDVVVGDMDEDDAYYHYRLKREA